MSEPGIDDAPSRPDEDGDASSQKALVFKTLRRNRANMVKWREMHKPRWSEVVFKISRDLYLKAETQNGELSEEEVRHAVMRKENLKMTSRLRTKRALLLSRGDFVGKALAFPETLTQAGKYEVLLWTEPDKIHKVIRRASDAETPAQLIARGLADRESLSLGKWDILTLRFSLYNSRHELTYFQDWLAVPGNEQAHFLIAAREEIDLDVLHDLFIYSMIGERPVKAREKHFEEQSLLFRTSLPPQLPLHPPPPPPPPPPVGYPAFLALYRGEQSLTDRSCWPHSMRGCYSSIKVYPETPPVFFAKDVREKGGRQYQTCRTELYELCKHWDQLSQEEKAGFEARSKVLRQAAWEAWDARPPSHRVYDFTR